MLRQRTKRAAALAIDIALGQATYPFVKQLLLAPRRWRRLPCAEIVRGFSKKICIYFAFLEGKALKQQRLSRYAICKDSWFAARCPLLQLICAEGSHKVVRRVLFQPMLDSINPTWNYSSCWDATSQAFLRSIGFIVSNNNPPASCPVHN